MRPLPPEQIAPVGPWPEGILPVPCPGCRLPLCIHESSEASPKRLVGTCVGCRAKYVIEWTADGTEAWIGRLSDGAPEGSRRCPGPRSGGPAVPPKRPRSAEPRPRDRGRSECAVTPLARLDLRGTVTGVESRDPSAADRLRLSGRGEVAPLGQVQASGTLTLAARQGDVFVHIYGTVGGPSRPHSVHLRYDITGGTGQYRGATGYGAVTYSPDPGWPSPLGRPRMFTLKFGDIRGLDA